MMKKPGVQAPTFRVEDDVVSISARDAERLADAVAESGHTDAAATAEKIREATYLGGPAFVELGIGEDEAVLAGLGTLRETRDFLRSLERLERAVRTKIERESA